MTASGIRATFGLSGTATPTNGATSGSLQVGLSNASLSLSTASKIHSFEAVIAGTSSDLVIDVSDLDSTGSTAWTAGAQQVETQTVTAASGATSSGNLVVTVTATGMTGTPKAINVPLVTGTHTTAALIAAQIATTLNADTDYSVLFTASSDGADVITKRKVTKTYTVNGATVSLWPADIADVNVAIGAGLGVSAAASSVSTTAGVLTAGVYAPDHTGNDVFGDTLGGLTDVSALQIKNDATSIGDALITQSTIMADYNVPPSGIFESATVSGAISDADITITTDLGSAKVTVTIAGL